MWLPTAIRAGMDCQTFWRSNPKRLKQFCEARKFAEDIDLQAWATGYYVASAFGGKWPTKPELLSVAAENDQEQPEEAEDEIAAKKFEAWMSVFNAQFRKRKGGDT